jgi:hypothetical protein
MLIGFLLEQSNEYIRGILQIQSAAIVAGEERQVLAAGVASRQRHAIVVFLHTLRTAKDSRGLEFNAEAAVGGREGPEGPVPVLTSSRKDAVGTPGKSSAVTPTSGL